MNLKYKEIHILKHDQLNTKRLLRNLYSQSCPVLMFVLMKKKNLFLFLFLFPFVFLIYEMYVY